MIIGERTEVATEVTSEGAAAGLAAAFDAAFMEPPANLRRDLIEVVVVHAGSDRRVVRRGDLAWVARCPRVTPLPSESRCLGLVRLRGRPFALLPVLGAQVCEGSVVLVPAGRGDLGLLVDSVESVRRLSREALVVGGDGRPMMRIDGALVPMLDLSAASQPTATTPRGG